MEGKKKYQINPFQYKEVFATFDHYAIDRVHNRLYVFTDDPSKLEGFDVLTDDPPKLEEFNVLSFEEYNQESGVVMKYQINPFQYKEVFATFDHYSVEGSTNDKKLYVFTDDPSKLKEFDVLSCEEYNEN